MAKTSSQPKRASVTITARQRAAEIHAELAKANGSPPFDRTICECLAIEGFKSYDPSMIARWRKADGWGGGARRQVDPSPVLLTYPVTVGAAFSLDDIRDIAVDGIGRHRKLADLFDKWLAGLDPATLSINDGLRIFDMLAKNGESLESMRVRLAEQQAVEAKDVTPPGMPITKTTPEMQVDFERLRARLVTKDGPVVEIEGSPCNREGLSSVDAARKRLREYELERRTGQ